MYYKNIREEEIKNKVGAEWFPSFDTTRIIGNIDFAVYPKQDDLFETEALLWAEAKTGDFDLVAMFVQLILTIGKARSFDKHLPPTWLGAFDSKKIAFVRYIDIQDIFYLNDFNWNVTPSKHESKEFAILSERIQSNLKRQSHIYHYATDAQELRYFIKHNVARGKEGARIRIDKNNFLPIYLRWLEAVKPIIDVDWERLKSEMGILDSDFYLADLFVDDHDTIGIADDTSIRDNLFVIYRNQGYKIAKESIGQMFDATISIRHLDRYQRFWQRYKRPPLKAYQEYIIERRDLLVPQDIRERKGAYFTPRIWVEKSQEYLAKEFGDNWQEDAEFQSDCLAFTLFHGQNRITCEEGINHWIPFTEKEVDAPELFSSHWMTDYISGKLRPSASHTTPDLFETEAPEESEALPRQAEGARPRGETEAYPDPVACPEPMRFSPEAEAVFDAGRALWRYYMKQEGAKADASYYDIRAYFQGFTERGGKRKMNAKSDDAQYTELVGALRAAVSQLGEKLRPKVYQYGFLKA